MSHPREPPRKRVKTSTKPTTATSNFTNVDDLQSALSLSQSVETLTKTLTILRNQFSLRLSEGTLSPSDSRLLLAQQWMGRSPGAGDLFKLWEGVESRQHANLNANSHTILSLTLSVLSSLLTILSSHYSYHSHGFPIIKTLLSNQHARKLNSFIGGSHTDLVLSSMKLLNSMSDFASGRERRNVLESFHVDGKTFNRLLNMRRKGKTDNADPLERPDIRTLTILLLCSFLGSTSASSTKNLFLDQHGDKFLAIFKGLLLDPYVVTRRFLELCWEGIWCDVKLPKKTKVGLFGEITLSHLLKIYDRTSDESSDPGQPQVAADLVHHFLLAICTRPGQGVCFRDRGWYPLSEVNAEDRGLVEEDAAESHRGGRGTRAKVHNKILANVLKTLKPNEDLRQQELTLRILGACPELIAGYWAPANLTLEPRLSSRWITNIALFKTIISLPTPEASFVLSNVPDGAVLYNPTPPPLSTIVDNILPSAINCKAHFSKGLQPSGSATATATLGLVQLCTAQALCKCLMKYAEVRNAMRSVADSLEESTDSFLGVDEEKEQGQWRRRLTDLEREVRRRVPDFQVVVGFVGRADAADQSQTKAALLSEVAHRLLWLYQQCLPEVSGEARFDLGKLLGSIDPNVAAYQIEEDEDGDEGTMSGDKLRALKQIHILRLLNESEQFKASWSGKAGSSKHNSLFILLKSVSLARAYSFVSPSSAVIVLTNLLQHILGSSIIFRQADDEVSIWLSCLPITLRSAEGSESPDGAPLKDEIDAVVGFLDECIQRCVKTPYRYIDDLRNLAKVIHESRMDVDDTTITAYEDDELPSPLLMTILEQLRIKVTQQLLTPSDVLAITSFLKKLLFRLSIATTGRSNLAVLGALTNKIREIFSAEAYPKYPVMSKAIFLQAQLAGSLLWGASASVDESNSNSTEAIKLFLEDVQNMAVPTTRLARVAAAFELVDWVRLVDQPLQVDDVRCVARLVKNLHPPALDELTWSLPLGRRLLWDGMDLRKQQEEDGMFIPSFELLLRHSANDEFSSPECRDVLRACLFSDGRPPLSFTECTKAIVLISRVLGSQAEDRTAGLLLLLQSLLVSMYELAPLDQFSRVKRLVFMDNPELRSRFIANSELLSEDVYKVLRNITISTITPALEGDRKIASDIAEFWTNLLKNGTVIERALPLAFEWVQYTSVENMFILFDSFAARRGHTLALLDGISGALFRSKSRPGVEDELHKRVRVLMSLPPSALTEQLLGTALESLVPTALNGLPMNCIEEGLIEKAEKRWRDCRSKRAFLDADIAAHRDVSMMCHAFYTCPLAEHEKVVRPWLQRQGNSASLQDLARVSYTYLDRRKSLEGAGTTAEEKPAAAHLARFVRGSTSVSEPAATRHACSDCVSMLLDSSGEGSVDEFSSTIEGLSLTEPITPELINIGLKSSSRRVREILVNHGLQWVVRVITSSGEIGKECKKVMFKLEKLLGHVEAVKPHIAEPVLIGVIQDRLTNISCIRLAQATLSKVQFKPLIVNRHLQAMVQSPQFHRACREGGGTLRDSLLGVLHTLFHLHPSNTCQASHVEPLVHAYRGTLSIGDQKLLEIFQLFETEKRVSVASLLARWSPSDSDSSTSLEGLKALDGITVLRSCLRWPRWRAYDEHESVDTPREADDNLYDPVFLILFVAHVFASDPPKSAVDWVEVFRTNIVGLLIRALSSKDKMIRRMSTEQLATLWRLLDGADMQEKPHVVHILSLLRDVLLQASSPSSTSIEQQPLPSHITLLLTHALRGIFYPSNFIYPLTARFLLQRPQLDVNDVPMLYAMLYSSNAEDGSWKKERTWMIRFLADGLQGSLDWKVFKRRHTWELVASMFGAEKDRATRRGILEVLANLTCIPQATTSLLLKSSLLSWIEIQLLDSGSSSSAKLRQEQEQQKHDHIAWIKILENLLVSANQGKMESITEGEWRTSIGRCLSRVLAWVSQNTEIGPEQTLAMLHLVARVMLRLTAQYPEKEEIFIVVGQLLDQCVAILRNIEKTSTEILQATCLCSDPRPLGPHTSSKLFDLELTADETIAQSRRWAGTVQELWRVSMSIPTGGAWDALTCRLLISRSLGCRDADADGLDVAEWGRRELIQNMHRGAED
ncbi:hypothetical protein V5O48_003468 [Marasmius crinis-equi]|uniref:Nucleolar pre-ribosomal-associated protein 1 n=1 Tax=Marasmius crinis-equi TaxID=585013 RepID=A0ABR3FTS6_9AGAR